MIDEGGLGEVGVVQSTNQGLEQVVERNQALGRELGVGPLQEKWSVLDAREDEYKFVTMGKLAVVKDTDSKKILATSGVYSCTAVVGYSEAEKAAYLMHIDPFADLELVVPVVEEELKKQGLGSMTSFRTNVVSSVHYSPEMWEELKTRFAGIPDVEWTKFVPTLVHGRPSEGVAVDAASGKLYTFAPDDLVWGDDKDVVIDLPRKQKYQ